MKTWKSLLKNRNVQMLALLGTLGASLSWNPAYLTMARHEFVKSSEFQLASADSLITTAGGSSSSADTSAPASTKESSSAGASSNSPQKRIELGRNVGLTNSASGAAFYSVIKGEDAQSTEIIFNYYTKDGIARTNGGGSIKLSGVFDEGAANNLIPEVVLAEIQKQLLKETLNEDSKTAQSGSPRERLEVESACPEGEDVMETLSCRQQEYEELASSCKTEEKKRSEVAHDQLEAHKTKFNKKLTAEERQSRNKLIKAAREDYGTCRRTLEIYYQRFLSKSVVEACKGGFGTASYQACRQTHQSIFSADLKPSAAVQDSLFGAAFNGVINQAWNMCGMNMGTAGLGHGFSGFMPPMIDDNRFKCLQLYSYQNGQMVGNDLMNIIRSSTATSSFQTSIGNWFQAQGSMNVGANTAMQQAFESFNRAFSQPFWQFNRSAQVWIDNKTDPSQANLLSLVTPYVGSAGLDRRIDTVLVSPGAGRVLPNPEQQRLRPEARASEYRR